MPGRKSSAKSSARSRDERRSRAVIDRIIPEVDCGRFAAKGIIGDRFAIEAHVFTDGHDALACMLRYRHENDGDWHETPLALRYNDEWHGAFTLERIGRYRYTVKAWVDHFLSWRADFKRRIDPADIASAALVGGKLIAEAANRAAKADAQRLRAWGKHLVDAKETDEIQRIALDED